MDVCVVVFKWIWKFYFTVNNEFTNTFANKQSFVLIFLFICLSLSRLLVLLHANEKFAFLHKFIRCFYVFSLGFIFILFFFFNQFFICLIFFYRSALYFLQEIRQNVLILCINQSKDRPPREIRKRARER